MFGNKVRMENLRAGDFVKLRGGRLVQVTRCEYRGGDPFSYLVCGEDLWETYTDSGRVRRSRKDDEDIMEITKSRDVRVDKKETEKLRESVTALTATVKKLQAAHEKQINRGGGLFLPAKGDHYETLRMILEPSGWTTVSGQLTTEEKHYKPRFRTTEAALKFGEVINVMLEMRMQTGLVNPNVSREFLYVPFWDGCNISARRVDVHGGMSIPVTFGAYLTRVDCANAIEQVGELRLASAMGVLSTLGVVE